MAAKYANKTHRVVSLDADFQQFYFFELSEIFTMLLWNLNNIKLVKKSKKIGFDKKKKKNPKIQFTIEIA